MAINHFNAMLSIIFENTSYTVTIRDLGRLVKLHFVKNLPKISLISIIRDDICSYICYPKMVQIYLHNFRRYSQISKIAFC